MFFRKDRKEKSAEDAPFFVAYRDRNPNGPMTVSLDPDQVESAGHAGIMVADFARHFARAMAQSGKAGSEAEALGDLVRVFCAEIDHPTGPVEGSLRD